jgi:hypothetical protein
MTIVDALIITVVLAIVGAYLMAVHYLIQGSEQ